MTDFFTKEDIAELLNGFDEALWGGNTINGVFNNNPIDSYGVETSSPEFTCETTDVSGAVHGNMITIRSVAYKIIGIQKDGQGFTTLILSRD